MINGRQSDGRIVPKKAERPENGWGSWREVEKGSLVSGALCHAKS